MIVKTRLIMRLSRNSL